MSRSDEAIARLRDRLTVADPALVVMVVRVDDLRALLDAHAALEAAHTEALARLQPFAKSLCDDSVAGYVCACEQCLAFRFLAKAGRR